MSILGRYVLRLHVAPFLFSATALTLLMLLDQVAKKFHRLVGKGLGWQVIAEVFLYSIPFIWAVIFPMAVLVAVLYTFNRLAGDNETAAMKANGVSLVRVMVPLLVAATLLAGGMVWFNDTVLPESNHRLQRLWNSIGRKKPTFVLRERTVNEVLSNRLFLEAARIDPGTSRLEDVTIYDLRDPLRTRTIYADSGSMAYDESQTVLFLTLRDGELHEGEVDSPEEFQRVHFGTNYLKVPEIGNELERAAEGGYRGDRELPIGAMRARADSSREEAARARAVAAAIADAFTRRQLGGLAPPADALVDSTEAMLEGTATGGRLESPTAAVSAFRTQAVQEERFLEQANRFGVEIQKKFSIPAACIVFVLIGAPIAVRYRRAGVALVVGVSLGFFCAYYVALIGGEHLADRRLLSPFWAMWAPNVLFGAFGLWAMWRQRRAGA